MKIQVLSERVVLNIMAIYINICLIISRTRFNFYWVSALFNLVWFSLVLNFNFNLNLNLKFKLKLNFNFLGLDMRSRIPNLV